METKSSFSKASSSIGSSTLDLLAEAVSANSLIGEISTPSNLGCNWGCPGGCFDGCTGSCSDSCQGGCGMGCGNDPR